MVQGNEYSFMKTLGSFLDKQCNYYQDIVAMQGIKDDRPVKITFGKIRELAHEIAGGMISRGVRPGDSVCIFSDSSIEWVIVFMATQLIGAIDVAYESNRDSKKMTEIINDVGSGFVFCDHEEIIADLSKNHDVVFVHLSWSMSSIFKNESFTNLLQLQKIGQKMIGLRQRIQQYRHERDYSDQCSIFFKQSVGNKKLIGVVHSHQTLIRNLQDYADTLELGENDLVMSTLPFWHSAGRLILFVCFYKASRLYASDDAGFLKDVVNVRPTVLYTHPSSLVNFYKKIAAGKIDESQFHTLFRRLYLKVCLAWNYIMDFILLGQKEPGKSNAFYLLGSVFLMIPLWLILFPLKFIGKRFYQNDIISKLGSHLRLILCGGAKLHHRVDDFFRTLGIPLLESYWLTEVGFIAAAMTMEMKGQDEHRYRGTVGMVLPSMGLKMIDHLGNDVSSDINTQAQIYVRGDNMMMGYLFEPRLTSELLDSNGWFRTGDQGKHAPNGDLVLLTRQSRFFE